MEIFLTIIKDTAITLMIAVSISRIEENKEEKWYRLIFIALLCLM